MSERVGVGIIGMGGAGLAQVEYFAAISGVEVVRAMDPHPEAIPARLQAHRLPPIPVTDRLEQVLGDPRIDLVSVCTPDQTHAEYVVAALKAGKHVVCEKALAGTRAQCVAILRAWRRSGRIGAVQHQFRFDPWFRKATDLVHQGAIGTPFTIHGEYIHRMLERSRLYHHWRFSDRDASPPVVLGGIHQLDMFRWMMQSEVTTVSAVANHLAWPDYPEDDCVESNLTFASGAIGRLTVALGVDQPMYYGLRVFGAHGTLADGYLIRESSLTPIAPDPPAWPGPRRTLLQKIGGALAHPSRFAAKARQLAGRWLPSTRRAGPYGCACYQHALACQQSLQNVVNAVRGLEPPLVSLEAGARACFVAFAITESYRRRCPVQVSYEELDRALAGEEPNNTPVQSAANGHCLNRERQLT
jgi:predicted dehydrogenase